MIEEVLNFFSTGVATLSTAVGLVVCLSTAPFAIHKKRWPELGEIVVLGLTTAGVVSGLKILVLTFGLDPKQLGPLADDKPALFIGGLAAFYASLREVITNWRKAAGI